ncbi:MAG TPA: sigma factor-like helix-turn-helix DNA-binding protein [Stellaceae bacterium]
MLPRLSRFALGLTQSRAEAADLIQSACERALGRVEQWDRLPEEQRIVLMLVCIEGMTYTEAAEAASIPVGTVMSRLARARLGLMQRLAENDSLPRDNVIRLVSK